MKNREIPYCISYFIKADIESRHLERFKNNIPDWYYEDKIEEFVTYVFNQIEGN